MRSQEWKGYILVLIYCFIGAIYYIGLKSVLDWFPEISGVEMVFWSYLGATVFLAPFFVFSNTLRNNIIEDFTKNSPWLIAGIGMLTGVGMVFIAIVLERSTAEMISIFMNSEILFTILLGIFWLKEKFSPLQYLGSAVAIIGFLLVSNYSNEIDSVSITLVIAAQVVYAIQNVLIKKYSTSLNPFSLAFTRMFFMLLATIPFFIIYDGGYIPYPAFFILVILVLLATFLSRAILYKGFQYIEVSKASVWYLWETVFVIIGSYIFFAPITTPLKIAGIICILIGVYLVQKK